MVYMDKWYYIVMLDINVLGIVSYYKDKHFFSDWITFRNVIDMKMFCVTVRILIQKLWYNIYFRIRFGKRTWLILI